MERSAPCDLLFLMVVNFRRHGGGGGDGDDGGSGGGGDRYEESRRVGNTNVKLDMRRVLYVCKRVSADSRGRA